MAIFHVSTTGNDQSSGTSQATAFRTLEKAAEAMRASAGGDTAIVHGGTYQISNAISLTSADSGSSFAAAQGETVVLSGGKAVFGWSQGANGIWTAPFDQADVHQLTLNGVRMTEARFPNAAPADPDKGGWLWAKSAQAVADPAKQMAFDKAALTPDKLAVGMKVHVFTDASWSNAVLTVQSVDWAKGVMTFAESADYALGDRSRFFVQDAKVHLDQPGEWFFDTAAKTLHFMAPEGFAGTGAVASGNGSIFDIAGASNIGISGFHFRDLATGAPDADFETAAVKITASDRVTVAGNSFENVAKAVLAPYHSHHLTIADNNFSHIWAGAIELNHGSNQNSITGNSIYRSGEVFVPVAAIHMNENWGNVVRGNLIRDVSRNGIQAVNYDTPLKSGGNLIEYNAVLHTSQTTSDSGGIYFYSATDDAHIGEIVRYNVVVDTGGLETAAGRFLPGANYTHGIYLDDNTSRAQITGNFVMGAVYGGLYLHGGSDNVASNNILLGNKEVGIQFFDIGKPMRGNDVFRNIVEAPASGRTIHQVNNLFHEEPRSLHDNFIYNPSGGPLGFELKYQPYTLAQWNALGYDLGTDIVANALFAGPTTGNFALKPGVLPSQHGFVELPWAAMQSFRGGLVKWGTEGADTLSGGQSGDVLDGLAGHDRLFGGGGADTLAGWDGNDTLEGGVGGDRLEGGRGADTASYESAGAAVRVAMDRSFAWTGDAAGDVFLGIENLRGSAFNDHLRGDGAAQAIFGMRGDDTLEGMDGADTLIGGLGADTLIGGGGNDALDGGAGADRIDGGGGIDTASYYSAAAPVRVAMDNSFAALGDAAGDVLTGIENLRGSAYGDHLRGDNSAQAIFGMQGDDMLDGLGGADTLAGGLGGDTLTGGPGADVFRYDTPGEGGDTIAGFVAEDGFAFARAAFGNLPGANISVAAFQISAASAAASPTVRFLYETDTGILRFDADGSGPAAASIVATLTGMPVLTALDITFF